MSDRVADDWVRGIREAEAERRRLEQDARATRDLVGLLAVGVPVVLVVVLLTVWGLSSGGS